MTATRREPSDVLAPGWITDNAPVWYYPIRGSKERHAGFVDGVPWRLGSDRGPWVVRLDGMAPTYRGGQRTTVPAAATWCIEPRAGGEG